MIQSEDFLNLFSTDERYFLSLPVLWSVTIDGVTENAINGVLEDAGENWSATINPGNMTRNNNIMVAQEVVLPQETSSFQAMESGSAMGGFLPGYGLNSRSNFLDRSFSINFLETKHDLEHNFFRPWAIAVGIKGLIASVPTLKSTISVQQYDNKGNPRKGFKFKNAFPTAVEGFTLNYENTEFTVKSVTFACQNYDKL